MDDGYLDTLFTYLRDRGFAVVPGLTEDQLALAEDAANCRFPPDLRSLLTRGLPVSELRWGFPDWRHPEKLNPHLQGPLEGILFDIEHNNFWLNEWGERPNVSAQAVEIAREGVRRAPRLVPIYGHRYLSAEPSEAGNPVFSVVQTDIIVYGADLAAYFEAEFRIPNPYPTPKARHIPFWSRLVELNG